MTAKIIFVLSEARTGSTLLCELLNRYKNTVNLHEIFHNVGDPRDYNAFKVDFSFNNVLKDHFGDGVFDPEKMLPRVIENPKKLLTLISEHFGDDKTLIVKVHLFQLLTGYPVSFILDWILQQPNHRFVLLERDFLKSYVSWLKAEQTNVWHNIDTTNIKVEIIPKRFEEELSRWQRRYNTIKEKLQENNIDYLYVDYDKDLKDYNDSKFEQLIEPWSKRQILDLKSKGFTQGNQWINVTKQNTDDDIANSILNWSEIKEILDR
jgi:hypothetical protein